MAMPTNDPRLQVPAGVSDAMYQVLVPLTAAELTSGAVNGSGAFDVLMAGMGAQLRGEFEKGRITGAEYTKAYIALTQAALQAAIQFVLGKDQAFWAAQQAQVNSVLARVQLEEEKYKLDTVLPAQVALTNAQKAGQDLQNQTTQFQLTYTLPQQLTLLTEQTYLVTEQAETARAQTGDGRLDGYPVTGLIGKQKDLYAQQIKSYERDAEVKAAKLFTDAWTVQKTVDDGLVPPNGFTNASLDTVLTTIKSNNGLG